MNVAMYLRKSRADENNPLETLERHKEILLSYAKDNNLTVIDIFEEVISGGMLYNRTEMLKLLDAIPSKSLFRQSSAGLSTVKRWRMKMYCWHISSI